MLEAILRNAKGKVVTVAPLELAQRFLKHECPDGIYSLSQESSDTDLVLERRDGVVYPTAGRLQGASLDPRSLRGAQEFFEA